jgi:polysaccharide deacetylase family protein (PEP-CTERM system associated)
MVTKNIITVDIEDWFHICGVDDVLPEKKWDFLESRVAANVIKILDILRQHKVRATLFVLGYIAERHRDLIEEAANHGHEIATHGYSHQRVYKMTPNSFREDLKRSVSILNAITRQPIKGYRAPEWSIRQDSRWALDILQEEGFEFDSSMAPLPIIGNRNGSTIPQRIALQRGYLWEFPPLVARVPFVSLPLGGGWGLRTFPYSVISSTIEKLNNRGHPAVIYLHPREFDPDNPRVRLPWSKEFVLNAGFRKTEQRLRRLLTDFDFTYVTDFVNNVKS